MAVLRSIQSRVPGFSFSRRTNWEVSLGASVRPPMEEQPGSAAPRPNPTIEVKASRRLILEPACSDDDDASVAISFCPSIALSQFLKLRAGLPFRMPGIVGYFPTYLKQQLRIVGQTGQIPIRLNLIAHFVIIPGGVAFDLLTPEVCWLPDKLRAGVCIKS